MSAQNTQATPEQVLYAAILEKFMLVGLLLMVITFVLYVSGVIKPAVPLDQISKYWGLSVSSHAAKDGHAATVGYLESINQNFLHLDKAPTGWAWMRLVGYSDFLNFLPIAILSGVTIVCYLAIAPGLFRRGDKAYAIMALAEAVILILAASGLLSTGGH